MKKKSLEKLLEKTKRMISVLLEQNKDESAFSEFGKGIKAGEEIALNSLLDYMNRCEEDLKFLVKCGMEDLF